MPGLFDRMLGRSRSNNHASASQAKERLRVVLVHDRLQLPPERMAEMKAEILQVISKYVDVESEQVDIALRQRDRNNSMIVAEIPFSSSVEQPAEDEMFLEDDEQDTVPMPPADQDDSNR